MASLKIYCDGGARGNPGPGASAFVVTLNERVIYKNYKYLGIATNNQAEYQAVIMALTWSLENAKAMGANEILITLDSQLVAQQLSEKFRVKNIILKDLYLKARNLENKLSFKVSYTYVPRSKNKLSDFLVNKALDEN